MQFIEKRPEKERRHPNRIREFESSRRTRDNVRAKMEAVERRFRPDHIEGH